ncbi:hypothetical protein AYO47_06030 [Planctomyces sp. SCGC AG-212-M04]|nr:hypothetical protein AYO47_06030 [Planctomyces sp. SCGC AG-212-M04]
MAGDDHHSSGSAHLLRFGAALAILVAVALTGVALEQRSLELARQSSLQTFRADRLEQQAAELRLKIESLQTPQRLLKATRAGEKGRAAANDNGRRTQ